uniref:Secreted protein n=1 Tax=Trichogramma kaykai TaxID=54128 RepID=A0ABD2XT64_9HYME
MRTRSVRLLGVTLMLTFASQLVSCKPVAEETPVPTVVALDAGLQDASLKDLAGSAQVAEDPQARTGGRFQNGMLQEFMSETRNNIAGAVGAANDALARGRRMLQSYERLPFANALPPRTRETVRLENEKDQAILERRKSDIGGLLDNVLKPKPIIDNIQEEEKYGNNGDRFIGVGRALVTGVEGLTNIFNAVLEFPVKAAKNTSRTITEALNQIGSRLVGLQ